MTTPIYFNKSCKRCGAVLVQRKRGTKLYRFLVSVRYYKKTGVMAHCDCGQEEAIELIQHVPSSEVSILVVAPVIMLEPVAQ